jgi:hypothetical protein
MRVVIADRAEQPDKQTTTSIVSRSFIVVPYFFFAFFLGFLTTIFFDLAVCLAIVIVTP